MLSQNGGKIAGAVLGRLMQMVQVYPQAKELIIPPLPRVDLQNCPSSGYSVHSDGVATRRGLLGLGFLAYL